MKLPLLVAASSFLAACGGSPFTVADLPAQPSLDSGLVHDVGESLAYDSGVIDGRDSAVTAADAGLPVQEDAGVLSGDVDAAPDGNVDAAAPDGDDAAAPDAAPPLCADGGALITHTADDVHLSWLDCAPVDTWTSDEVHVACATYAASVGGSANDCLVVYFATGRTCAFTTDPSAALSAVVCYEPGGTCGGPCFGFTDSAVASSSAYAGGTYTCACKSLGTWD